MAIGYFWIGTSYDRYIETKRNVPIVFKVVDIPIKTSRGFSYSAQIIKIGKKRSNLKVRVLDSSQECKEFLKKYFTITTIHKIPYNQHILYKVWLKRDSYVVPLSDTFFDYFIRWITYYVINSYRDFPPSLKNFLLSSIWGHREFLSFSEREIFIETGTMHIMAISGLHVGILVLFLNYLLKILRMRVRLRTIITIVLLFIYSAFCGFSPSVFRTVTMYSIFMLSFFLSRKVNPIVTLCNSGFLCLLLKPQWINEISFQLSFIATFFILLSTQFFIRFKHSLFNYLYNIFVVSLFASIGTLPLISFYFGRIYMLSPFVNILIIPYFTLIVMVNFIFLLLCSIPFLSALISYVLIFLTATFFNLLTLLSKFFPNHINFKFNLLGLISFYLFSLLFIRIFSRGFLHLKRRFKFE